MGKNYTDYGFDADFVAEQLRIADEEKAHARLSFLESEDLYLVGKKQLEVSMQASAKIMNMFDVHGLLDSDAVIRDRLNALTYQRQDVNLATESIPGVDEALARLREKLTGVKADSDE